MWKTVQIMANIKQNFLKISLWKQCGILWKSYCFKVAFTLSTAMLKALSFSIL